MQDQVPHYKTKIVATVGPASSSFEVLRDLALAGVNVFRLNFSHGSHEDKRQIIKYIEKINIEEGLHVAILADLQGPKLRVGKIKDNALPLVAGDVVTFTNQECIGTKEQIYMSYEGFAEDVNPGETVLVDDGKLVFEVLETNKKDIVKLQVKYGGTLSSNKGVNLPNTKVRLPSLTEKDLEDLEFIFTETGINWIALSFVRTAEDVEDLRRRIEAAGHRGKVLSKIEKPEAIENIDAIIKASNAIMVARGDLGIEVPLQRLPILQKDIIRRCVQWARPVIVATHMLDSMVTQPIPTRAEITDVANAVLDCADAVMLSGETATGAHPVLVVQAMRKIISEAEKVYPYGAHTPILSPKSRTFHSDSVCFNAADIAGELEARAIVGMTASGYTAFKMSACRPKTDIYIFSDKHHMVSTLSLCWGVQCFYYDKYASTDQTIADVNNILVNHGLVMPGDVVVNTASMPIHKRYRTNMIKVTVIEDPNAEEETTPL